MDALITGDQAARRHAADVNAAAEARGLGERHYFHDRAGWCCTYHDGYADGWDAALAYLKAEADAALERNGST